MQEKIQKFSQIKQNILHFIDSLNISKRDFYTKTGISRGTLESNTGITEETLTKLFATYPNLNIEWVFYQKGSMLKEYNCENTDIVCEPNEKYGSACKNCLEKDKLIATLEKLSKTQSRTIELLEDRLKT